MATQQSPRLFGLLIYREHQDGASVEELSAALQMPSRWIEERIEAVRLCMEKQVRVELTPVPRPKRIARTRTAGVSIRSANKRRSL
jgi:hypothetical protein